MTLATLVYSKSFLVNISKQKNSLKLIWKNEYRGHFKNIDPTLIRSKKRGKRSGLSVKLSRNKVKIPLPTVSVTNLRSVTNKIDELEAVCRVNPLRNALIWIISETWLTPETDDTHVELPHYMTIRSDRTQASNKQKGGGLLVYLKQNWCGNNVKIMHCSCTSNIELLAIRCRPYYLPREFTCINVVAVYCPPSSAVRDALDELNKLIDTLENTNPDGITLIGGDFNQLKLDRKGYNQMITCHTRLDKTLDKLYANLPLNSFSAIKLQPIGLSDHNVIYLIPQYVQKSRRYKPTRVCKQTWSKQACETLNECLMTTDWSILNDSTSLDLSVDVITCYIDFCVNCTIPKKTFRLFSNNKPWISREIVNLIQERRQLMTSNSSKQHISKCKAAIRRAVRKAKQKYAERIDNNLKHGQTRTGWTQLKKLLNLPTKTHDEIPINLETLNQHFCRFEDLESATRTAIPSSCCSQIFTKQLLLDILKNLNPYKPPGPDNIYPKVLKFCRNSLVDILILLFARSLHQGEIPGLWKSTKIRPLAKCKNPSSPSDYRPIAITSAVIKVMEKALCHYLQKSLELDPLQFAYRPNRGTDDALLCLTDCIIQHLNSKAGNYARCLFIDFTSAFNTVTPHKLIETLLSMGTEPKIAKWIEAFLIGRKQFISVNDQVTQSINTNTGTPQGSVISPLLFTIYTDKIRSRHQSVKIIKYADDMVIVGLHSKDGDGNEEYTSTISQSIEITSDLKLILNTKKTKEMIICRSKVTPTSDNITINGEKIDTVQQFKYLGTIITADMSFKTNCEARVKSANCKLHLLRKLKHANAHKTVVTITYNSFIYQTLLYALDIYYGHLDNQDKKIIDKVTKTAMWILSNTTKLEPYSKSYERRLKDLILKIYHDETHPFNQDNITLPSGRLKSTKQRLAIYKNSFRSKYTSVVNKIFTR